MYMLIATLYVSEQEIYILCKGMYNSITIIYSALRDFIAANYIFINRN